MKFYTNVASKGTRILQRGWDKDGSRVHESIPFRPTLYMPTNRGTDSPWRTIGGKVVAEIDFESPYESRDFIKKYNGVDGVTIYGDIDAQYQFIAGEYAGEGEVEYDPSLVRIMYIDIEVESENGFAATSDPTERVNGITIRMSNGGTYSLGLREFSIDGVECRSYDDREDRLLSDFVDLWEELDPDIITGWNVKLFDMPYLFNRIERVLGRDTAKRLSPWRDVKAREIRAMNEVRPYYEFVGVTILDYYDLYDKFTFTKRESYKLEYIASVELGEGKVSYEDYGTITDFYRKDFQRFMEYNVRDVMIVEQLEAKMRLVELALGLTYSARCNYGDVFTQTRMWDTIIYNYLRRRKIVVPPRANSSKGEQFVGAYVKDPQIGQHEWIASFDLDSMYPMTIIQLNLCPSTLISEKELMKIVSEND